MPDTLSLMRLSEALGVSVDFLVTGQEHRPPEIAAKPATHRAPTPPRLSHEQIRPQRGRPASWR